MIKILNINEVSNNEIFSRDNIAPNVEGIVTEIISNVFFAFCGIFFIKACFFTVKILQYLVVIYFQKGFFTYEKN